MNLISAAPIVLGAGQLVTGPGSFKGITVRETAGVAATVRLFDNTSGAGTLIGTYGLPALGSIDSGHLAGRRFVNGLFAVITGTVEGSVFV